MGHIKAQTTQTETQKDFQNLMDQVLQDLSEDKSAYVILDDDCSP